MVKAMLTYPTPIAPVNKVVKEDWMKFLQIIYWECDKDNDHLMKEKGGENPQLSLLKKVTV